MQSDSSVLFELHIVVADDASDILCAQDNSRHRHQTWTVFPFGGYCSHLSPDVVSGMQTQLATQWCRGFCWMPVVAAVITQLCCFTNTSRLCYCWRQTAGTCEGSLRVDVKSGCFVSLCGKVTTYLHLRMSCTTYCTVCTRGLFMLFQNQLPHYLRHISDLFQLHVSFVSLIHL